MDKIVVRGHRAVGVVVEQEIERWRDGGSDNDGIYIANGAEVI